MTLSGMTNIIAALKQTNCVSQVNLSSTQQQMEQVFKAMWVSFSELTDLQLALPLFLKIQETFLGGLSPHLQTLQFPCALFLGLVKQLVSATHLVELHLVSICLTAHASLAEKSLPYPGCPASNYSNLISDTFITITEKAEVYVDQNTLSSCSYQISFHRLYSLFRGIRELNRHPSTCRNAHKFYLYPN